MMHQETAVAWQDLFDQLNEAVVICDVIRDAGGRVAGWSLVGCNPAWQNLPDITRRDLVPGLDGGGFGGGWPEALEAVVQTSQSASFACKQASPDRYFESRLFHLHGDRFAALCLEVTSRKAAEDDARSLAGLVAQSTDFIAVTSPQGGLRYINPAGLRMIGQSALGALRDSAILDLLDPQDGFGAGDKILAAVQQYGFWGGELNLRKFGPEGAGRAATPDRSAPSLATPVHFTLFPLRDAQGAPTGFGSVTRDITERRRAEARRMALLDLGDRLRNIDDPADMAFAAAEIMATALVASRAGYGRVDAASETITIARDWTAPGVTSIAGTYRFADYGAYITDLRQNTTVVLADVWQDPRTAGQSSRWDEIGARAVVNHPIFEHGAFVALFFLQQTEPRRWAAEEVAFVQNVADRTRAAIERGHAERNLRDLAASLEREVAARTADRNRLWRLSTDIMLVADFDATIHAVNPAWGQHLGWEADDLIGRNVIDLCHPDDRAAGQDAVHMLAEGLTLRRFDVRLRHRAGGYRWITWTAVPGEGLIHAVGRDCTDERARAEALELSEGRLRSVFETTSQLQGLLTLDGMLLDANPSSLAAIEAALEEVKGLPLWRTPWFTGTPGLPDLLEAALPRVAAGETFRQEIVVNLPTGRRAFDFALHPVRNTAGDIIAIVPEATELTERRAAEAQLRQAQKMEAVGQLTGGLAHDFNNLLTGIIGSLAMLRSRMAKGRFGDLERFIDAAESSAKRAASLTHRLLAFARQQTLDPKIVHANALIFGMVELIRRTVGPQIEVRTVLCSGLWATRCDPHQLESALLNLCINARDAMPAGGRLTLQTGNVAIDARSAEARDMEPGDYMTISVSDTGTGMAPDTIARAFDPFFTTKPIGQGTGLGLSMVYGFTKQSNGQVRIHSQVGEGTTVTLHLQRHEGGGDPASDTAPAASLDTQEALPEGATALVVDDEPFVAMLITDVLEDLGCAWIDAADGATALEALRSERRIDLLISDIGLPGGMNGRQLGEAARVLRPGLKILFVTGYSQDNPAGEGIQVITKPFAIETLTRRIQSMLAAP
jgi:PAS domain S-box-containing protein